MFMSNWIEDSYTKALANPKERLAQLEKATNNAKNIEYQSKTWVERFYIQAKDEIDATDKNSYEAFSTYKEEERQEHETRMDTIYKALVDNADALEYFSKDDDSWYPNNCRDFIEYYAQLKEVGPQYYYDGPPFGHGRVDVIDKCDQLVKNMTWDLYDFFDGKGIMPDGVDVGDDTLFLLLKEGRGLLEECNKHDALTARSQLLQKYTIVIARQRYDIPDFVSSQQATELVEYANEHKRDGILVNVNDLNITDKNVTIGIVAEDPDKTKEQIIEFVKNNNLWSDSKGEYDDKIARQLREDYLKKDFYDKFLSENAIREVSSASVYADFVGPILHNSDEKTRDYILNQIKENSETQHEDKKKGFFSSLLEKIKNKWVFHFEGCSGTLIFYLREYTQ